MDGLIFALTYIALVYLILGFFKVSEHGSYETHMRNRKRLECIKKEYNKTWRN